MDGWMDGCMHGWMAGWTDEWIDGWMCRDLQNKVMQLNVGYCIVLYDHMASCNVL